MVDTNKQKQTNNSRIFNDISIISRYITATDKRDNKLFTRRGKRLKLVPNNWLINLAVKKSLYEGQSQAYFFCVCLRMKMFNWGKKAKRKKEEKESAGWTKNWKWSIAMSESIWKMENIKCHVQSKQSKHWNYLRIDQLDIWRLGVCCVVDN